MSDSPRTSGKEPDRFTQKVLKALALVLGAVLLLLLIGKAFEVLLLVFAGVLMAVFFRGTASALSTRTGLSGGWSLTLVVVAVIVLITATVWLLAPQVSEQAAALSEELPKAVGHFRDRVEDYRWGRKLVDEAPTMESLLERQGSWVKQSLGVLSTTFGILANLYVVLFLGLFITAQPGLYKKGIVLLFPMSKRQRASEVLNTLGVTLYKWLLGKLFSMLVVGVFTTVGLSLLNIPVAMALGLLAGLLSFVPNFGPLFALIPAVLIALLEGPDQALYVVLLYTGIQAVESNILTPLVQKKMIEIPPALIIVAQLLLGVFSGVLGLILATPIIAVVMVLVKMLYVHDTLGDKEVEAG
ncbi:AI-2E family transporter [Pontibacter locisalis]|uniref:AI-2E family transporter n=1 Tax=Pontibacter locisalis TaxID=1719035 RepID=A0ABW5IR85_9BACT